MQIYCGTDIIEVERIKEAIESNVDFKYKVYTQKEIQDIDHIKSDMKYQRYAGRFAAKEAVYKALSQILCNNNLEIEYNQIEVENIDNLKRRPKVDILENKVKNVLEKLDCNIDLSISHVKDTAIAMVVVKVEE
ncbi:MAG: holo-ACP synthase [Clostridia bacterium]|nr:holo-ACP synthase [Clostridia bacterium]